MVELGIAERRIQQEEAVVRQYALRWAVLAGWRDALAERLLKVAAVRFRFADCGVPGCRCEAESR